jgi:hypothetical protein
MLQADLAVDMGALSDNACAGLRFVLPRGIVAPNVSAKRSLSIEILVHVGKSILGGLAGHGVSNLLRGKPS